MTQPGNVGPPAAFYIGASTLLVPGQIISRACSFQNSQHWSRIRNRHGRLLPPNGLSPALHLAAADRRQTLDARTGLIPYTSFPSSSSINLEVALTWHEVEWEIGVWWPA